MVRQCRGVGGSRTCGGLLHLRREDTPRVLDLVAKDLAYFTRECSNTASEKREKGRATISTPGLREEVGHSRDSCGLSTTRSDGACWHDAV
jgi:hypothetical protein